MSVSVRRIRSGSGRGRRRRPAPADGEGPRSSIGVEETFTAKSAETALRQAQGERLNASSAPSALSAVSQGRKVVGEGRFELPASASRTLRANQAALLPDGSSVGDWGEKG